ncbi:MAG TPA: hypothetical protein PKA72_11110 [bacterium]|nr:hypothetical protein [bacterium]
MIIKNFGIISSMTFFKNCYQNTKSASLCIFAVALLVRLVLINNFFENYTQSDGVDYHNIAVNIVHGNGYSRATTEPYEPYFFREPAYPIFLSAIYKFYSWFGSISYLSHEDPNLKLHGEIMLARIVQSFIGAGACVIFYLTLLLVLSRRVSFIIAFLFSLYFPFAIYASMLMRETLQSFFVLSMTYCFARLLISLNLKWNILFSLFWSLSNLCLQITLWIFPFAALFMLIRYRAWFLAFRHSMLSFFIMMAIASPWLIRTYSFYPDIRVFKSFGTSLTHEYSSYISYLNKQTQMNQITQDSLNRIQHIWYNTSEYQKFENSFAGTVKTLYSTNSSMRLSIHDKLRSSFINFRTSWIESLWFIEMDNGRMHLRPHTIYMKGENYFLLIASLIPFVFGYLALPGILFFLRKTYIILMPFSYFFCILPLIGNEPRRALPIHAFIFMFSILMTIFLYKKVRRSVNNNSDIFNEHYN